MSSVILALPFALDQIPLIAPVYSIKLSITSVSYGFSLKLYAVALAVAAKATYSVDVDSFAMLAPFLDVFAASKLTLVALLATEVNAAEAVAG